MHINCVNVADMFSGYMFITDLWTNFSHREQPLISSMLECDMNSTRR